MSDFWEELKHTPLPSLESVVTSLMEWIDKPTPEHLKGRLKHTPTAQTKVKFKGSVVGGGQLFIVYDDESDTLVVEQ